MNNFNSFGIKPNQQGLTGDKIKIDRILNREVIVHDYKIVDSKYEKGNGKCLHLQIEVAGNMQVVFTGSAVLMEMIDRVPKSEIPFKTTIVREQERFEFT